MKVQELRNRVQSREKVAPHIESTGDYKTFLVAPQTVEEFHLRIVRTDALIQELLQRGQFRKAMPTQTYGAFDVEPEFAEMFQALAGECGLSVREATI